MHVAKKYLDYMGGIDALMQRAQSDFDQGEYRWVAEVMKHAVYALPKHVGARELAARALEQMGFQAESATWRNAYLLGAHEYRNGPPKPGAAMGNSLMSAQAFSMAWHFTDTGGGKGEHWLINLSNGALSSIQKDDKPAADVSLALTRTTLEAMLQQKLPPIQALSEGKLKIDGKTMLLATFFGLLDKFTGNFAVVDAASLPG